MQINELHPPLAAEMAEPDIALSFRDLDNGDRRNTTINGHGEQMTGFAYRTTA